MLAKRGHASDVTVRLVFFNHCNRRQSEIEVAVTAVFGDWRILPGFKPSRRTASQAAGGPPPESLAAAGGVDGSFNADRPYQLECVRFYTKDHSCCWAVCKTSSATNSLVSRAIGVYACRSL